MTGARHGIRLRMDCLNVTTISLCVRVCFFYAYRPGCLPVDGYGLLECAGASLSIGNPSIYFKGFVTFAATDVGVISSSDNGNTWYRTAWMVKASIFFLCMAHSYLQLLPKRGLSVIGNWSNLDPYEYKIFAGYLILPLTAYRFL